MSRWRRDVALEEHKQATRETVIGWWNGTQVEVTTDYSPVGPGRVFDLIDGKELEVPLNAITF